jgi:putative transposase
MYDAARLNHTTWDCKSHIVWMPEYQRKLLYGDLQRYLGEVFREPFMRKESGSVEGHLMADPVHVVVSILPEYSECSGDIVRVVSGHLRA